MFIWNLEKRLNHLQQACASQILCWHRWDSQRNKKSFSGFTNTTQDLIYSQYFLQN